MLGSLGPKTRFMKKRPTSVTVIAWILFVTSYFRSLCHFHVASRELGTPAGAYRISGPPFVFAVKPMLIPGILVYAGLVFFLLRPKRPITCLIVASADAARYQSIL